MVCRCTGILTEHPLKARILFEFVWLVSHVLGKGAPGFAWEKLFINSQVEACYVALLTIFYKTIPHLRNQAKFVSLSPLSPTKKVIESQMFHDFLIPIAAHDIFDVLIHCFKVALLAYCSKPTRLEQFGDL